MDAVHAYLWSMSARIGPYQPTGVAPAGITPDQITNLTAWYRGDTVVLGGGAVQTWTDLSGNGRTVTQGTLSLRPTVLSANLNGKDVLSFDGSDDILQSSVALSAYIVAGAFTCFSVFNVTAIAINDALSYRNSAIYADNNAYMGLHAAATGPTLYGYVWDGAEHRTSQTIATGTWYVVIHYFNGSTISTYVRGIGTATASSGNVQDLTSVMNIGRSYATVQRYFNGKIAEVGFYNRQLTAGERTSLEAYLASRYNL